LKKDYLIADKLPQPIDEENGGYYKKNKVSDDMKNTLTKSLREEAEWKPAINVSYETLCLTQTTLN